MADRGPREKSQRVRGTTNAANAALPTAAAAGTRWRRGHDARRGPALAVEKCEGDPGAPAEAFGGEPTKCATISVPAGRIRLMGEIRLVEDLNREGREKRRFRVKRARRVFVSTTKQDNPNDCSVLIPLCRTISCFIHELPWPIGPFVRRP